jgi:hypothetical protein
MVDMLLADNIETTFIPGIGDLDQDLLLGEALSDIPHRNVLFR